MKALVIYDSLFGNTEQVARAVAGALAQSGEAKAIRVGDADVTELASLDLLIVGTPIHGGRPTKLLQGFLDSIPAEGLANVKVATFDTRVKAFMARIFGWAADRMATTLEDRGGTLLGTPTGFFVADREGPLVDGELDRAAVWAKGIAEGVR